MLLLLLPVLLSCSRNYGHVQFDLPAGAATSDLPYYPARTGSYTYEGQQNYTVYIWQDEMLHYMPLMEKFGYYGNGVTWAELCRTMLKLENPALLAAVTFDEEAGMATLTMPSEQVQQQVAQTIHKWATDKEKLRKAFEEANRLYME